MKQIHLNINIRNIIEKLPTVIYTVNDAIDEIITIACDFDNPDIDISGYPYLKWTVLYPKECFVTPSDISEMPVIITNALEEQIPIAVIKKFMDTLDIQTETNYIKMSADIDADLTKAFNIIEYLNRDYLPENSNISKKIIVSQNLIDWFLGSTDFKSDTDNYPVKPIALNKVGTYKGIDVYVNNMPNYKADEIVICYGDQTRFHYIDAESQILMELNGNECIFQAAIQGMFKKEFDGINYFKIKK